MKGSHFNVHTQYTCLNKTTSVSEASKITLTDANYNHFETNLAENNKLSV